MKKAKLKGGIYAITANNKIIYIGKALNSLEDRYKQHKRALEGGEKYGKIYSIMKTYKELGFEVRFQCLIQIEDLYINEKEDITERELEMMELALIHVYQPIGNIQGVSRTYNLLSRE